MFLAKALAGFSGRITRRTSSPRYSGGERTISQCTKFDGGKPRKTHSLWVAERSRRGPPRRTSTKACSCTRFGISGQPCWRQVEAGAAVAPAGVVPPAISAPANTPQRQRLDIERANGRERRFALHLLAFFGPGIGVAALLLPASAVRHFCWSGVCLFASTPSSSPALSRLKISARSRDAWASEFANHLHELAATKEGGGAPKGAYPTSHAVLSDVAIRDTSAARATDDPAHTNHPLRARSPSGAPPRLSSQGERFRPDQGRASRDEVRRHYPRLWIAFKPSTWLAGHHAGGDDALTAQVRSVWLRPQEPPSLPFGEYPRPKGPHIR